MPQPLRGPRPAWELVCLDRPDRPRWRARVERDRVHVAEVTPSRVLRSTWDVEGRLLGREVLAPLEAPSALEALPLGPGRVLSADREGAWIGDGEGAWRRLVFRAPFDEDPRLIATAGGGALVSGSVDEKASALVRIGADGALIDESRRVGRPVTDLCELPDRTVRIASVEDPWRAGWDIEVERPSGVRCHAGRPSLAAEGQLWFDGWLVVYGGREVWGMPVTRTRPIDSLLLGPYSPLGWLPVSSLSAVPGLRALRARLWARFRGGLAGFRLLPFGTTAVGPIEGEPLRVRWSRLEDDTTGVWTFSRATNRVPSPGVLLIAP